MHSRYISGPYCHTNCFSPYWVLVSWPLTPEDIQKYVHTKHLAVGQFHHETHFDTHTIHPFLAKIEQFLNFVAS